MSSFSNLNSQTFLKLFFFFLIEKTEELKIDGNEIKGTIPEDICEIKGLKVFVADCGGHHAKLICECCTECV